MNAILEVRNLVKKYGEFIAVKGISFEIQAGEIFSLLGPNGAGKTTTISMLSTLYAPTSGDAVIGGHSITKEPMAVKQVIGVVPQELALYEDLTARENLVFWGQMYGLGGKSLNNRVDEVLVKLLNQRARYAIEIGEIKGVLALPIYAPEREKQVLLHVEQASEGPLEESAVRRLFERIIDESRRVERQSAQKG